MRFVEHLRPARQRMASRSTPTYSTSSCGTCRARRSRKSSTGPRVEELCAPALLDFEVVAAPRGLTLRGDLSAARAEDALSEVR